MTRMPMPWQAWLVLLALAGALVLYRAGNRAV